MAREKATITLDRSKAAEAQRLTGARSTSEVIDIALARLLTVERLRRDVRAYTHQPPTAEELAIGDLPVVFDLDDAEIDYDALYG
jgi:Bacterial antitoxin of type II TA system, VapB